VENSDNKVEKPMANYINQNCKKCKMFWSNGKKDSKSYRWCCKFGKEAEKAIGECKLNNAFSPLLVKNEKSK
jgi:hypothetical protein